MSAFQRIPALSIDNIEFIKSLFEQHVDRAALESYRLPITDPLTRIITGMSGGADSSVLGLFVAAYLAPHYPNMDFLFTDTKQEPDSCYIALDRLEALANVTVTRLVPEKGLFDLVEQYNGFLPGNRSRWCTRELKVDPLKEYIKGIDSEHGYINLAGIRYDEADRDGITFQHSMDHDGAAYPFVDLKITRAMVFDILDKAIGIPATYAYRSRSGCFCCFFQRNAEILGMLANDPKRFAETEAYEKLSERDSQRWAQIPTTLTEAGIPAYYPVPAFIDLRKDEAHPAKPVEKVKARKEETFDLFGFDDEQVDEVDEGDNLYAAFTLYTDSRLLQFGGQEFTPGVYWQEFTTVSTSLSGIKSALGNHYAFKKTTPMPHYDLEDMQIVIAHMRFPKGTIDSRAPGKDSYTWKSNVAYKQLRHLAKNVELTLQCADLERRLKEAQRVAETSTDLNATIYAEELVEALEKQLGSAPKSPGKLVWEGIYTPSETVANTVQMQLDGISVDSDIKPARENLEYDEVPRACISCSI